jgi:hypothetical protein
MPTSTQYFLPTISARAHGKRAELCSTEASVKKGRWPRRVHLVSSVYRRCVPEQELDDNVVALFSRKMKRIQSPRVSFVDFRTLPWRPDVTTVSTCLVSQLKYSTIRNIRNRKSDATWGTDRFEEDGHWRSKSNLSSEVNRTSPIGITDAPDVAVSLHQELHTCGLVWGWRGQAYSSTHCQPS